MTNKGYKGRVYVCKLDGVRVKQAVGEREQQLAYEVHPHNHH